MSGQQESGFAGTGAGVTGEEEARTGEAAAGAAPMGTVMAGGMAGAAAAATATETGIAGATGEAAGDRTVVAAAAAGGTNCLVGWWAKGCVLRLPTHQEPGVHLRLQRAQSSFMSSCQGL